MIDRLQFYINGEWVDPVSPKSIEVVNPATEDAFARISLGSAADVDKAVAAAKAAFESFSKTSRDDRVALLSKIIDTYKARYDEIVDAISTEMGAPTWLSKAAQAATGIGHFNQAMVNLKDYEFTQVRGTSAILKEPVGVCGLIVPWNWPINQVTCKVAPALAAGCTMVLKSSEIAPMSAILLAEVLHEAGVPAGVFNLVNGDGKGVGEAISAHPDIDMVSFTGSTRAGIMVAKSAADTVKRVALELGGKSANVILADADLDAAVSGGTAACFRNSGQSCNAPTRMLVPAALHERAVEIAKAEAANTKVGDPSAEDTKIGPVASEAQYRRVQGLIAQAIDEGSDLVAGGLGRPKGLERGFYVRPTIFANVTNDMTIAREEVFGPVLAILPYKDEDDAVAIANDSPYGLSGYVSSGDLEHAKKVAARLRTGMVHLNGAGPDFNAPFGGYKQSGNGREWGEHGFEEFLEVKAVLGYAPTAA